MAKDPAFLFYTNDFLSGVQFFSNEEIGIYMRLLCAQHQHGRLSEKQVLFICNSLDCEVIKKFTKDDDGFYYNIRLENEINKRKSFSESRAKNRIGKTKETKKQVKNTRKTYVKHMENRNRDENKDINKDKSDVSEFEKTFAEFEKMRKQIKKPLTDHAKNLILADLEQLAPNDIETQIKILNQSTKKSWQGVFPLKTEQQQQPKFTTRDKVYDKNWEPNGINK